jgi:SAM-dependent methyltransferase
MIRYGVAQMSEDHYRGEAGRRYQQQKRAVAPAAFPWVSRLRAAKFQPFIRPSDTVVELGVGLGWNLAELKCARRIGTDLEDFLPPELKASGVEFAADSKTLANELADCVICHHVLEHVPNPPEFLLEARRLLKPGGVLLLHVPFEKEGRYRRYNSLEPNHHLYSWNAQTLGNLVAAQGFAIESAGVGEFGYDRFSARLATHLHVGEAGFLFARNAAHLLRKGLEVRIVARKKADGAHD